MIQQLKIRLQRVQVNFHRFGLINTVKYLLQNAIVKRPINQINYYLKRKKYPQNIIDINSFNKVTGRKRGKSDDTKFVRKGVSGEWKIIFNKEQKSQFSKIGENIIEKLRYIPTL